MGQKCILLFCIIHGELLHILFVHAKINTHITSKAQQSAVKCWKRSQDIASATSESFQHNKAFICSCVIKRMCKMKPDREAYFPNHDGTYSEHIKMIICVIQRPRCGGGSPSRRRRWEAKWCFVGWLTLNCFFKVPHTYFPPLLNAQPQGLLYIHDINAAHT